MVGPGFLGRTKGRKGRSFQQFWARSPAGHQRAVHRDGGEEIYTAAKVSQDGIDSLDKMFRYLNVFFVVMETRIGSHCQVPIPTSTTAVAGIKPSDSGLSSRFFAPTPPAGLLFAFLSVLLFPSSLQTLLSLPLPSKPLCLPPPPPPLTEPCPRLTLPGLNRCRCPFGSGTAGAAAARRAPLPPFTACPPPPVRTRHVFLIASAVSSYFNGAAFTFFTSADASFPVLPPRSLRRGRRCGALPNYTTGRKKPKKTDVSHFRAGQ